MVLKILNTILILTLFNTISSLKSISMPGNQAPTVQTNLGGIRGHYKKSYSGRKFEAYEGIPYALPPVGKKRFEPPEPVEAWTGNLSATKVADVCLQYYHTAEDLPDRVRGSEDCLYLNVYVPAKKTKQALPVLFAIHGGGYQYGRAPTGVEFLMDREIIVVSVNYRLGIFGFLSTEDELVPGNMGLKDQSLALRWVSDNIASFGGDKSKITLIGISAGGASVHYHYLSPLSKGLFQNGISLSGATFGPGKRTENLREKTFKLADILGCPADEIQESVACLKSRPARSIAQSTQLFMPWLYNPFTPFGPTVEKTKNKPFVDRSAIEIINSGDAADVPWFTSLVSEEGLYPCAEYVNNDEYLRDLDENWETIAPHLLDYNFTLPLSRHAEVARKIRAHYFGTKPIDRNSTKELISCVGDRLYAVDAEKAARWMAKMNKSPVYFSYFSYRALTSNSDKLSLSKKDYGVSHGDDMDTIFNTGSIYPPKRPEDRRMQLRLIDWVTSVMEKGHPDVGVEWKRIDPLKSKLDFMHFSGPEGIKMERKSNWGEGQFWSTIDFDENKLP